MQAGGRRFDPDWLHQLFIYVLCDVLLILFLFNFLNIIVL